jgi:hypothetical protein
MPGYTYPAAGYRYGFGSAGGRAARGGGYGRRCRNIFHATGHPGWWRAGGYAGIYGIPAPYAKPDPEIEKRSLKSQAEALRSQLDFIQKRLAEMETGGAAEVPPSA